MHLKTQLKGIIGFRFTKVGRDAALRGESLTW